MVDLRGQIQSSPVWPSSEENQTAGGFGPSWAGQVAVTARWLLEKCCSLCSPHPAHPLCRGKQLSSVQRYEGPLVAQRRSTQDRPSGAKTGQRGSEYSRSENYGRTSDWWDWHGALSRRRGWWRWGALSLAMRWERWRPGGRGRRSWEKYERQKTDDDAEGGCLHGLQEKRTDTLDRRSHLSTHAWHTQSLTVESFRCHHFNLALCVIDDLIIIIQCQASAYLIIIILILIDIMTNYCRLPQLLWSQY